jgi:hypothetical protein
MKIFKIISIPFMAMSLMALLSCNDDFEGEIVKDNEPEIPVIFEGATTAGFNPYYSVSYASGTFEIKLTIPSDSKLKIKEVTKVVAGATAINVASLKDPKQYITPQTVDGYSFTLTSSLAEYNAKCIPNADGTFTGVRVTAAPATFTERAFMFQLTMEDGSVIVPVQCRIRIKP